MESIMDLMTGIFRGETLARLSSQLDAPHGAIERGVTQAVPLAVAGLAEHARSEQGANALLGSIRNGTYPHVDPADFTRLISDPMAAQRTAQSSDGFSTGIFGNKLGGLMDTLSSSSGLSRSSAGTLFGLVMPLVMGWLGKQVTTRGLDARGLTGFLADEGKKVSSQSPAGLGDANPARPRALGEIREHLPQRLNRGRSLGWIWLPLIALGLLLLWLGFKRPGSEQEARSPAAPELNAPAAVPAPAAPPTERQPVAGKDAIVLTDDARPLSEFFAGDAPVPQRFVLEDIQFDTGSARVAHNPMLDEAARILRTHPGARARVEGHTDREGSGAGNRALSQRRADAVENYLVGKGVARGQLTAQGMSELNPIADNDTATGRADNRRVELIITQR